MRLVENRQGRGLYSGNFPTRILESTKLRKIPNPIQASEWIASEAERFAREFAQDRLRAIERLFDRIRLKGGRYGIKFDVNKVERPDGCYSAYEVAEERKACCLEQTYLFLSICNQAGVNIEETTAIGFIVSTFEGSTPAWHACGGVLLDIVPRHLRNRRFEMDPEFRRLVLEVAGLEDRPGLHLLMLDFTIPIAGAQHIHVIPMSDRDLVSTYLANSGNAFASGRTDHDEGMARLEVAMELGNLLALANLIGYSKDRGEDDRVIELTDDSSRIVNSEAMIERAKVLLMRHRFADLKLAAMKAIQLSRHYLGYHYLGIGLLVEDDQAGAAKAFEQAYKLGSILTRDRVERKAKGELLERVDVQSKILLHWVAVLKALEDGPGVVAAIETHLIHNSMVDLDDLSEGEKKRSEGLVTVKEFGSVRDSFIDTQNAFTLFNVCLELGQLDHARELLDAAEPKLSVAQKLQSYGELYYANGWYREAKDFLREAFFAAYGFRDPGEADELVKGLGFTDLHYDRERHELFFRFKDIGFFTGVILREGGSNKISLDIGNPATMGRLTFFGNVPMEYEPWTNESRSPNIAESSRFYFRALSLFRGGKTREAAEQCSRAIELDPENADLRIDRTMIYERLGDLETVRSDLERVLEIEPDNEYATAELENIKKAGTRMKAWFRRTF